MSKGDHVHLAQPRAGSIESNDVRLLTLEAVYMNNYKIIFHTAYCNFCRCIMGRTAIYTTISFGNEATPHITLVTSKISIRQLAYTPFWFDAISNKCISNKVAFIYSISLHGNVVNEAL